MYKSIADRWEKDETNRRSCNEESQKQFGKDFTREDAYDADEMAAHEKELGAIRKVDNAKPASERKGKYTMPKLRSAQSGGSGTRRRVGTEEEARALAAVKGRGKSKSKDHGAGNGKTMSWWAWVSSLYSLEQRVTFSFKTLVT